MGVKEDYDSKPKYEKYRKKGTGGGLEPNAGTRKTVTYATGRDGLDFQPAYVNVNRGSDEHKKMMEADRKVRKSVAKDPVGEWDLSAPMRARKEIESTRTKDRQNRTSAKFFKHTIKGK